MRSAFLYIGMAAIFCAVAPIPAIAQSAVLIPLERTDQLSGWKAVGRVDVHRSGYCTGTLIGPDLVLTAGHCLFAGKKSDEPLRPEQITFRAGYRNGTAVVERKAARYVVHPDYVNSEENDYENLRTDVALIQLEEPIASSVASAFHVTQARRLREVSLISYARGRDEVLSWQRGCHVVDEYRDALIFDCLTDYGSSGAPVFDTSGMRAEIVSIISGGPKDRPDRSIGMKLPARVAELKEALRTGTGVVEGEVEEQAAPTRLLGGQRNSGTGALFVRP